MHHCSVLPRRHRAGRNVDGLRAVGRSIGRETGQSDTLPTSRPRGSVRAPPVVTASPTALLPPLRLRRLTAAGGPGCAWPRLSPPPNGGGRARGEGSGTLPTRGRRRARAPAWGRSRVRLGLGVLMRWRTCGGGVLRAPSRARTTTEGGADETVLRTTGRELVVGHARARVPPGEACGCGSTADTGGGLHVPVGRRTRALCLQQ